MRAAPPLVFPSSRVLAGWWRQLAPLTPRALAVGHLLLHHVEALVLSEHVAPLDSFPAFVLRALTLSAPPTTADLEGRLHLGRQFLSRILGELVGAGLAETGPDRRWRATATGRTAVGAGEVCRAAYERRPFHFRAAAPPPFVPVEGPPCQPVAPPAGWSFDPAVLQTCVGQSPEWKLRHGFPTDVRAVLEPDAAPAAPGEPPAWRRVLVDQAEHLVLALVVTAGEEDAGQLRGFAVDPRGWLLSGTRPCLSMGPGWPEAFPEVAREPPPEAWAGAWRTWCQAHGIPPGEADACALNREGVVLRVAAPRELSGRLRPVNGESPREEVWLLAGEGAMRTAARLEFV
jgi:hypothetical protein